MILALDTSTSACTAALFADDGRLLGAVDEVVGRGHAEQLVPLIAQLLDGRRPGRIIVGCGPGSFTGIRVGIAAAHGLAIGWGVPLAGMSSLALLAAGSAGAGPVAAAMDGGHGELFVQSFERGPLRPSSEVISRSAAAAAAVTSARLVVGPAASALIEARGSGTAQPSNPSAAHAIRLPAALASLEPRPIYPRAPDARPRVAA